MRLVAEFFSHFKIQALRLTMGINIKNPLSLAGFLKFVLICFII